MRHHRGGAHRRDRGGGAHRSRHRSRRWPVAPTDAPTCMLLRRPLFKNLATAVTLPSAMGTSLVTLMLTQAAGCSVDEDCSYNGVCAGSKTCTCDPVMHQRPPADCTPTRLHVAGMSLCAWQQRHARALMCTGSQAWTGSHCQTMHIVPGAVATGLRQIGVQLNSSKVSGAHTIVGNTSTWGGATVFDNVTGRWFMWATELQGHCGMHTWTTNSQVRQSQLLEPPACCSAHHRLVSQAVALMHCCGSPSRQYGRARQVHSGRMCEKPCSFQSGRTRSWWCGTRHPSALSPFSPVYPREMRRRAPSAPMGPPPRRARSCLSRPRSGRRSRLPRRRSWRIRSRRTHGVSSWQRRFPPRVNIAHAIFSLAEKRRVHVRRELVGPSAGLSAASDDGHQRRSGHQTPRFENSFVLVAVTIAMASCVCLGGSDHCNGIMRLSWWQ